MWDAGLMDVALRVEARMRESVTDVACADVACADLACADVAGAIPVDVVRGAAAEVRALARRVVCRVEFMVSTVVGVRACA